MINFFFVLKNMLCVVLGKKVEHLKMGPYLWKISQLLNKSVKVFCRNIWAIDIRSMDLSSLVQVG